MARNTRTQGLEAQTQHHAGGAIGLQIRVQSRIDRCQAQLPANGFGFIRKVVFGQQLAQVVEHRAEERFFRIPSARVERLSQLAGQQT